MLRAGGPPGPSAASRADADVALITVIAHRGQWSSPAGENSAEAVRNALANGFWLELDVRATRDRVLILSHDASLPGGGSIREQNRASMPFLCSLEWVLVELRSHDAHAFLHIKELDLVPDVYHALVRADAIDKCTLFADLADTMTLVDHCGRCFPDARTALHVRSSEDAAAMYDVPVASLWLDEQAGPWMTSQEVARLRRGGGALHVVSPEVWAPDRRSSAMEAWKKWIAWGVDGVCTDLSVELDRLNRGGEL